ncbi:CLUMA_CG001028, isoform A [Clunio marinus]|uniref:CLUMA_CG001028, isoform A n=1 Tax=Clunio marinus TaxID=568069 RepID=A0A1J1HGS8_9DIPT|nr:CLUMA_CG001028, isoform A [Clunio marinus]
MEFRFLIFYCSIPKQIWLRTSKEEVPVFESKKYFILNQNAAQKIRFNDNFLGTFVILRSQQMESTDHFRPLPLPFPSFINFIFDVGVDDVSGMLCRLMISINLRVAKKFML